MKFSLRTPLYATLAILVAAILLYAFIPPAVEVDVTRVARGNLEVTVNEDGKTRIKERYVVSMPLSGELLRVDLHAGDPVRAGDTLLAVIEPGDPALLDVRARAEAVARVKAAEAKQSHCRAQLERARATHAFAQTEHDRSEKLLPEKAVSQEAYNTSLHLLRTAAEDVRAAEFAEQIAEFELKQVQAALTRTNQSEPTGESAFEIRSPINGEVLRVFQESSATLPVGTRLMELGDRADLEVEIDVLSSDGVRIPLGAKVYLEHWGATKPLMARVRLVEPQAFLKVSALGVEEQRVNVIADFVDPPTARERLGDAYRVESRIVIWQGENVLKVNAGALFRNQGAWAVYQVVDGRAQLTLVEVGRSNGLETEIIAGLKEDDVVVAYPSDQVHDGVRVALRKSIP